MNEYAYIHTNEKLWPGCSLGDRIQEICCQSMQELLEDD